MIETLFILSSEIAPQDIKSIDSNIIRENGFKSIKTFIHQGQNISKATYAKLLADDEVIVKPKFIEHYGYLGRITDHTYMLSNFTSQSHIKTPDGNIPCIRLENNILKYVTPAIIVDDFAIDTFLEISNKTPRGLDLYGSEIAIDAINRALGESYNYSCNNFHSFYNLTLDNFKNRTFKMNTIKYVVKELNVCEPDKIQIKRFENEIDDFMETRKIGGKRGQEIKKIFTIF